MPEAAARAQRPLPVLRGDAVGKRPVDPRMWRPASAFARSALADSPEPWRRRLAGPFGHSPARRDEADRPRPAPLAGKARSALSLSPPRRLTASFHDGHRALSARRRYLIAWRITGREVDARNRSARFPAAQRDGSLQGRDPPASPQPPDTRVSCRTSGILVALQPCRPDICKSRRRTSGEWLFGCSQ
jgi:hypothetical protein